MKRFLQLILVCAVSNVLLNRIYAQTLSTTGSLSAVSTTYGTASSATSFALHGSSLAPATATITISAPAGFEVDAGSGYGATATVNAVGGNIPGGAPGTTVNVRLAATTFVGTYSGNVSISGGSASPINIATVSSTVSALALTITGVTASDKTYDRTTSVSVSGSASLVGVLGGDAGYVALNSASAAWAFAAAAVNPTATVNGSGYALAAGGSGDRTANYSLTQPSTTAAINPVNLTITGISINNKVYDGGVTATISGVATLNGILGPDVVTVSGGTAVFTSNGTTSGTLSVPVTVSGYTLGGAQGGNYTVTQPTGLTATIYAQAPSSQPTGLTITNITNTTMRINYSAAGNGSARVLVAKQGGAVSQNPVNGTTYAPTGNFTTDPSLTGGNVVVGLITSTSAGFFDVTNLTENLSYNFAIFEFKGAAGLESYFTTSPLAGGPQKTADEPLNHVTGLTAAGTTSAGNPVITLNWTGSSGSPAPASYIILARDVTNGGSFPSISDGTAVPGNDNDLSSQGSTWNGSQTITFGTNTYNGWTNNKLTAGNLYEFQVVPYTTAGILNPDYKTSPAAPTIQVYTEPTTSANNPTFSNITPNSIDVTVAGGTGASGYVVIRKTAAPTTAPSDGTTYTAGSSTIGGNPVVYVGPATTFTDGSLLSLQNYIYDVYAFSGTGALINYKTTSPGNANTTTLCTPPASQAAAISFGASTASSVVVNITRGSGTNVLLLIRNGSAAAVSPVSGTAYTASNSAPFTSGSTISGYRVAYNGTGPGTTSVTISNLSGNTAYNFKAFEFNSTGNCYLVGSPASNDFTTPSASQNNTITLVSGSTLLSSMANNQAGGVVAFQWKVTDIGGDNTSSRISDIVLRPGPGNAISTFTDYVLGAELSDDKGSTPLLGTVAANTITFSSIPYGDPNNTPDPTDLGTMPDNTNKTYFVKVWFKTTPTGAFSASTIDGQRLVLQLATSDITVVSGKSGYAPTTVNSGGGGTNGFIDVTASVLTFSNQPPASAIATVPFGAANQPILTAKDANGNFDLSSISASVTTPDATLTPTSAPTGFVNGTMDFSGNTFYYATTGNSRMTVTTTSAPSGLTVTSTAFTNVTASTTLGSSSTAMASSPLINSTSGTVNPGAGSATNAVLGFNLATSGSTITLSQLVFTSTVSVTGLVSNFNLWKNTTDSFLGASFVANSSTLTFSSLNETLTATPTYYFLVCDVAPYFLTASPTIRFSLPAGNFTVSTGSKAGSTQNGIVYTLSDLTVPVIQSITTMSTYLNSWGLPNFTTPQYHSNTVEFLMTFSEPVQNMSAAKINQLVYQNSGALTNVQPSDNAGNVVGGTLSQYWKLTYTGVVLTASGGYLYQSYTNSSPFVSDMAGNVEPSSSFFSPCCNHFYYITYPKPSNPVTIFSAFGQTPTSLSVTWQQPSGSQVATHYLVRARETSLGSFPVAVTNGQQIPNDPDLSDGYAAVNITNTSYPAITPLNLSTGFSTGLKSGVSYTFEVYPYSWPSYPGSQQAIEYNLTPATLTTSTTVDATAYVNPFANAPTISSLTTSQALAHAQATPNIQFQVYDDPFVGGTDNAPTKFTGVVIRQSTGNAAALNDWTQVIAGAEITDGTTVFTVTNPSAFITPTQIIFTGFPSTNPSDFGYVSDNVGPGVGTPKTYSVNIWLKSSLPGSLPDNIDNLHLAFLVDNTSFTFDNTSNNQKSTTFQPSSFDTGPSNANQITVDAQQLFFSQNLPDKVGVGHTFAVAPVVEARDNNTIPNLDKDFTGATISTSNGINFSNPPSWISGKLTFNTFTFNDPGLTQITVSKTGVTSAVSSSPTGPGGQTDVRRSANTSVNQVVVSSGPPSGITPTPTIESITTFGPSTVPTPGELAATKPSFSFIIKDDDAVPAAEDDKLPTRINSVTIRQNTNNGTAVGGATFDNWTNSIQGAELSVGGVSVGGTVTINSNSIVFGGIANSAVTDLGYIADDGSRTYVLKIWLKNPVTSLQDIIDNEDFVFEINNSTDFPVTSVAGNYSSTLNTITVFDSGDGKNKVDVSATQLDFVTQWASNATQYYDKPLTPTPAAKARDKNGNLDVNYTTAVTVATASPVTYPVANSTVTNTTGQISFVSGPSGLGVTSAGGGLDGATTNLVLTSAGIPTSGNGISNTFTLKYDNASTIVRNTGFTHQLNIDYATSNNQTTSIASGTGTTIEQFTVKDGGGSADLDGTSTVLGSITFTVQNIGLIRNLALFNNANNKVAEVVLSSCSCVSGNDITITGLPTSGNAIIAPDDNNIDFTVKASFISAVTANLDNSVININVKSVVAAGVSSSFVPLASTTMPVLASNENAIEVIATQFVYTTIPASASLNVPFAVTVQAQDGFGNLDHDYNGTVSAFSTTPGSPSFVTANPPSGAFGSGLLNFPGGFQFTAGNGNTQLVLSGTASTFGGGNTEASSINGATNGTSPVISVITSFDSWLFFDPNFAYTSQIDFVPHQTTPTTKNSQAIAKIILSDGGFAAGIKTNQFKGTHNDTDGAFTKLSSFTITFTNANWNDIQKVGLYTGSGTQIGSDVTPLAGAGVTGTATFNAAQLATTYYAPDDDTISYIVRAVFKSAIIDQHQITMQITSATHSAGSDFPENGPAPTATVGGIAGGGDLFPITPGLAGGPNYLDVRATSLDFTHQASPAFAGINEPVGSTFTAAPVPTDAAIVTARDQFQNIDNGAGVNGFNFPASSITITSTAGDNILSPSGFVNGVLNLEGMEYATPGDGTLRVQVNGLDSSNPPAANTSAIVGGLVNVINVTATYNGVGVLGTGAPAPATAPISIKGGSLGQVIFGVTFTASGTTASEPKLSKFSISFDTPFSSSTRTIFSNFVVREGTSDINGFGGSFTPLSSKGDSNLDSLVIDLGGAARPFDPTTHQLTYYLIADVDATANISTPPITPQFKDGGYLSLSDKNIVVTKGTASGTFLGNAYSFASTKPPVLITAQNAAAPNKTSIPYNGQLNVSAQLDSIRLRFDTKVTSLDGVAELWNRNTNTKVADLIVRNNPKGNFLVSGDYKVVDNPVRYKISFLPGQSFKADTVYYVTIKKGDFNPLASPPSGHGISDEGLNFYGGISSNSTLYFKISSNQPLVLSQPTGKIYNPSVASISTVFDQFGTAFYLVLPAGSPAPASGTPTPGSPNNQVKVPANYPNQSLIRASGSYTINRINSLQTVTFPATDPVGNPFVASQNYDVYIYAENDANPVPISSGGIYGSSVSNFAPNGGGATIKIKAPAAPVAAVPQYLICPGSFVSVSEPMILDEATPSDFSAGTFINPTKQEFNVLLPTGYQFDLNTLPDVQLIGADFNGTQAVRAFASNSVLKITYKNFGSASTDHIVISNLRVFGTSGSATLPILRFFGSNTSFTNPTATLATIGLFPSKTYNFNNSYSKDNSFPAGSPTFVDAIPDNYIDLDPNIKGAVRLLPIISISNDYNASIFDGTGVTNDLLTLSAVPTNAAFNINMNHTDPNGCNTQVSQQYLVYDHTSPISKKLGTSNSVVTLPGTAQALINGSFPNPSSLLVSSQTILDNELAGYELKSLSADIPASVVKNQKTQIISGSDWQAQVQKLPQVAGSVTNVFGTFYSYKWDYSHILNARTEPGSNVGGSIKVDPYYGDTRNRFDAQTAIGNTYWKGGSLGQVEFTGLFQSTADLSVYIPFRQDVELFVPAVPLIEVASSNQSFSDASDSTVNNSKSKSAYSYIKKTYGFQYTNPNGGYQGTSVFCEKGGAITLNGYPAALAGTSTGTFAIYDFQSFDFGGLKTGTVTTQVSSSAVVGTGTLFTTQLKVGSILSDASGNVIGTVRTITDNLHLTLNTSAAITITSSPYQAIFNTPIPALSPPSAPGFVDNANGSMTLDPTLINNQYNDILVAYTYQENSSPAVGTGYFVIRITPNPVAQFTIASTPANPGASTFDAFCSTSLIAFDAKSVSSIATSSQGTLNKISNYTWDFGDPNSGLPNSPATPNANPALPPSPGGVDTQVIAGAYVQTGTPASQTYDKPVHIYNVSTVYPVSLSLTSNWGCPSLQATAIVSKQTSNVLYAGSTGTIKVGDNPTVDFSFTGNCVGDAMIFTDNSKTPGQATSGNVAKFEWAFGDAAPGVIDYTGYNTLLTPAPPFNFPNSPDGRNNVSHTYTTPNFYQVTLTTTTDLGCKATVTKNVAQLPWKKLPVGAAYNELFDTDGGWLPLNFSGAIPTDGRSTSATPSSWYYNASIGKWTIPSTYAKNEKSALYSACIDLSSIARPLIQLNSFVDLTDGEGLVLQYSKDTKNIQDKDKVWDVLGTTPNATTNPSPGLDWYSGSGLSSNPGTNAGPTYSGSNNSSGYGWSNKQVGHLKPKHKLEDIKTANALPNDRVILRFAFASSNAGGKGVTLDSVHVGSRTRTILFENFTSSDAGTSNGDVSADATAISTFVQANLNSTQLVNINYHVGFIGMDPFNLDNPADPSSRALYYNVRKVPYAFLDGKHYTGIDPTTQNSSDLFKYWGQGEYDLNTLQLAKADFSDPSPSTKLTTVTNTNPDGSLQVDVNFTPVFDLPFGVRSGTVLQIAILEKSITAVPSNGKVTTGETSFEYVLKKMLPNAAGTKFTNAIKAGIPVSAGSFKWIPENLHSSMLTVVVFLQNEDTKEVYQAFIQDIAAPAPVTAIEPITADNIKVYPNPSDQEFTIELPSPAQQSLKLTMANQLGQFTEVGDLGEGEQSKKISTQGLAEGVYILQLGSNGNALRTKVVVLHK